MTISSASQTPTSSLQRALASSSAATTVTINLPQKGAFENCFATGLDLSEFGNASTATKTSAAKELLKVKQKEQQQKELQEQEDRKLEEKMKKRLMNLRNKNSSTAAAAAAKSSNNSIVVNALVQMHGGDETYRSKATQKSNRRASGQLKKGKFGKSFVKKGRKSKY